MNVRKLAKDEGIDLNCLLDILRLRRPDGSDTEKEFVKHFIDVIPGMQKDLYGNRFLRIGDTATMWSCHTDTVSRDGGNQNIEWNDNTLRLHKGKPGQSLGADDGAGVWLLIELIKAEKPGLYVFHRAEEVGGKGSFDFAKNQKDELVGIKRAIAFDRRGTTSVITRQRGSRTCSDTFGKALATALGLGYEIDDTGVFTDTANYDDQIPECTNISCGYENEHGPKETLDVAHLLKLRTAVLGIDFEALPTERDPTEIDNDWGGWGHNSYYRPVTDYRSEMQKLVERRAYALALWFEEKNWAPDELDDALTEFMQSHWQKQSASYLGGSKGQLIPFHGGFEDDGTRYENVLWCSDCADIVERQDEAQYQLRDRDQCQFCNGEDTYVDEELVDA